VKLLEKITGFSRYDQVLEPLLLSQIVESQRMRVSQSERALILVLVSSAFYIGGLWNEVDSSRLLVWFGLIIGLAITRVLICRRVEQRLAHSTVPVLYRNELMLYFSSLLSTPVVGSGYWWIAVGSDERVIFAVVLLTLIYAIGTTINSSIQYRGFTWLLVANLGQGIIFLLLVMDPADTEAGVAMLAIAILLSEFGKRSAAVFNDSIRIREENREQNIRLEKDKLIVEKSLNVARKANEEKNRFMAAASHDLRQPLHAMTLFLGSLRHIVTDSRTHELLDKIDETSTILHEQFNSLLDLSKFDAGVVTSDESRFRLDLMLKNIADAATHDAQKKNVSLHLYTVPVVVKSDMLLMERLLRTWGCPAISASLPEQVELLLSYESYFDLIMIDDMLHDDVVGLDIAMRLSQKIPEQRIIMAIVKAASARLAEIKSAGFEVLRRRLSLWGHQRTLLRA